MAFSGSAIRILSVNSMDNPVASSPVSLMIDSIVMSRSASWNCLALKLTDTLIEKAKILGKTIVLPETEDVRVIQAAELIVKEGIAKLILVGNLAKIRDDAKVNSVNIDGVEIIDPKTYERTEEFVIELQKLREKKGMTIEQAREIMLTDPRFFGAMLVRMGLADGMVAGSNSPTAQVLKAAIQVIGVKPGLKTVSSSFIMITKTPEYGYNGVFVFSDGGVIPDPTAEQMADIAILASEKAKFTAGILEPKVAFLSFSTKGSAEHPMVTKVQQAVEILKTRNVDFDFDGELQLDAAIVPKVGAKKAPGSKVAGVANVLIFPDLNSGNISYKIVERLAGAKALGPLIQGLAKPTHDLSRGCSVQDIVEVVAITSVESEQ